MSLHVCLGAFFFLLDSRLDIFGNKLSFWLSACIVLIVVPLVCASLSFGVLERKVLGNCIESYSLPSFLFDKCREEIASAINDFGNRWCKHLQLMILVTDGVNRNMLILVL